MRRTAGNVALTWFVVGVTVGCTPATSTPEASGLPPEAVSSPGADPGEPAVRAQTSEEKIAEALAAGEIDEETSLRYRAFALFGDSRLPSEYQSEVIDIEAGMALAAEVQARESELPTELLEEIHPFLARPNDPASVLFQPPEEARSPTVGATAILASALDPARDEARVAQAGAGWDSRLAAGGIARVWAYVPEGAEGDITLAGYEQVVSDIWPHLDDLIREPNVDDGDDNPTDPNPDSAIDIYFVNFAQYDTRWAPCVEDPNTAGCRLAGNVLGMARSAAPYEEQGQGSSGYLMVQSGIGGDYLKGTVGHELFHLSQFSYDHNESLWLYEATATWAEFRILQKMNAGLGSVHDYLPAFFDNLDRSLPYGPDGHQYGGYTFFLHAQMERGDDVVRKIWERAAAAGEQGIDAVAEELPLLESFPDFALRSWNQEPVETQYESVDDSFPDVRPPNHLGDPTMTIQRGAIGLDAGIEPLGVRYFHFDFPDPAVRSATFTNTLGGDPEMAIQALVRLPDGWQEPETWTNEGEVTFCRDRPDEDVQELVVIISNSHTSQRHTSFGDWPTLEPKPTGCERWTGTVTSEWSQVVEGQGFPIDIHGSLRAEVTWEPDPSAALLEGMAMIFKPIAGSASWQESGTVFTCTVSGDGTYSLLDGDFSSPDPLARDAYLAMGASDADERRYEGYGRSAAPNALSIMSCPDAAATPYAASDANNWLSMDTHDPDLVVGADGWIRGSYTSTDDSGTRTQTWEWAFEPDS